MQSHHGEMARVITASGDAIGVDEAGSGGAVPIVFLHGVGSDKSVWAPQLAHFGATRRAVAFDYPGYGESDPAIAGTTRDDFAAAMWSALDSLDIGKAHVCGLSLGGVIAIAMHHAAAERCASLIIADSFALHPDGQAIYERSVEGSENMAALAEARMPGLVGQDTPAGLLAELIATMSRIDPAAFRIGVEAVWLADQRDRLGEIHVPTLVIVGDQDPVTPPALSHELVSMISGAELQIIAGAGHLTNIEMPDRFNAIVETFIQGVEARA
jgi:3-oxoadipate enol-lactonase